MYRVCDVCGGVDEHPRHSFTGVFEDVWPVNESAKEAVDSALQALTADGSLTFSEANKIMADFLDTTQTDRHIDCCAEVGCPKAGTVDGCDQRTAVWNGETGDGMVDAAMQVREDNPEHFLQEA